MIFAATCECRSYTQTVEGKLNTENNTVVCQDCGQEVKGISKYTKTSMRLNKDTVDLKKRAFMFKCESHNKMTEVFFKNSKVMGKDCHEEGSDCLINISTAMKTAVKEYTNSEE